jgi:hypothetical protein
MTQKNTLMKHYVKSGYRDIDDIKQHYNKFAGGGPTDIEPEDD